MTPPGLRSFLTAFYFTFSSVLAGSPLTCTNPELSCHNTTIVSNLCCFNAPGGQLLQTQFWDTSPSTGPSNSWTIHGLWPDNCDGTYSESCDASREHSDITTILQSFGKTELLDYMNIFWKNSDGTDEELWSHEWDVHGTCINTLDPGCYIDYVANQEVVDFYQTVVDLFQTLDTYTTLANAGIVPSSSKTYTSAEIQAAFENSFGFQVALGCTSGALNQVLYYFDVRGSVVTGTFVPTSPVGSTVSCPSTGIKYLLKSGSPAPTTFTFSTSAPSATTSTSTFVTKTTTKSTSTFIATTITQSSTSSSPTGTSGTLSGKGTFNGFTSSGSQIGCLISKGTWYVGGTCATFTAHASGNGFTLSTSKGTCGVSGSIFSCGSGVSSIFTTLNGNLAVDGNSQFHANAVPSGSTQETLSTSSGNVAVTFQWEQ